MSELIQIGDITEEQWIEHFTELYGGKGEDTDIEGETNIENNKNQLMTEEEIKKKKKIKNRETPSPDQSKMIK